MIIHLLLSLLIVRIQADVACYHCYGNSTTQGQLCTIDNLCLGESCFFEVEQNGEWSAGCSNMTAPPTLICPVDNERTSCYCTADLCNQFKAVSETLTRLWENNDVFNNVTLALPELSISCIECGNVTIAGRDLRVPCAERHICRGDYCVAKRGRNPHTYCGSLWDGSNEERCIKQPGEAEVCVCAESMCNVLLSQEAMEAMIKPSTTTTTVATTTIAWMFNTTSAIQLPEFTISASDTFNSTDDLNVTESTSPASNASNITDSIDFTVTSRNLTFSSSSSTQSDFMTSSPTYSTASSLTSNTTNFMTSSPTYSTASPLTSNITRAPERVPTAEAPLTGSTETLPTAATSATTPVKKKKCKNTMKFSPNAQAVFMGQKLGQAISEGFGNGSEGVHEFKEGIDTHICNYSE